MITPNRDPRYNRMVNPLYNRMINPLYNRMVNPLYNRMVNPLYNRVINPLYNRMLNPSYNSRVNPTVTVDIDGLYLYDWSGNNVGFVVYANANVLLVYNLQLQYCSYGVVTDKAVLQFDANAAWIGTWISSEAKNYNIYDKSMQLTGFTT